jgi:hypothetical protein
MRKIVLIFLLTVCILTFTNGQEYKTAVGLRGGFSNGLTVKQFIRGKSAFEGILATRYRGIELTGLYEIHNPAFEVEHLNWYFGFGAHLGFYNGNYVYWGHSDKTYTMLGVDAILGIEYCFTEAPINIGIDWKPAYNMTDYPGFWADGGALSIRYFF